MKKFLACKSAVIELKQVVDKSTRDAGKQYGVLVAWNNQDFTVTEIGFHEPNTIAFRHLAIGVQTPNTLSLSNGQPFFAEVVAGHSTTFVGV